jgi:L-threonylcarbamoyladenylate synthase
MILLPTQENLKLAVAKLNAGELVAVPTETVYGLAANAFLDEAVTKIFALKLRPSFNPLILHYPNPEAALKNFPLKDDFVANSFNLLSEFWPGPLTVVLPTSSKKGLLARAHNESVGIRVPRHPVIQELLAQLDFPLAAPSANIANCVSPTRPEHVLNSFPDAQLSIIDGGSCNSGLESTIVSLLSNRLTLLRPGNITVEELEDRVHQKVFLPTEAFTHTPVAPGQLAKHYSPKTKLLWLDELPPIDALPEGRYGVIYSGALSDSFSDGRFTLYQLSERDDYAEVAKNLYNALRSLDSLGLTAIYISRFKELGLGRAIMDRLKRAVHS